MTARYRERQDQARRRLAGALVVLLACACTEQPPPKTQAGPRAASPAPGLAAKPVQLPPETEEALRALGYVE